MQKLPLLLFVAAAPVPAIAAELPAWMESPVIFTPADISAGERQVAEGEVFVEVPLRWALAATLERDVTVASTGEPVTLKAGEALPRVFIPKAGSFDRGRTLICTRSKVIEKREGVGLFAKMVDDLRDSLSDAQRCVEDTDGDGKVDRALVLGVGSGEILDQPIEPTAYRLLTEQVIAGGEDKVTLTLRSVGNTRTWLTLNIVQRGNARMFDELQSGRFNGKSLPLLEHKAGFPVTVDTLGIRVSILGAEKKQGTARLRWNASAEPTEFVMIPRTTNWTFR